MCSHRNRKGIPTFLMLILVLVCVGGCGAETQTDEAQTAEDAAEGIESIEDAARLRHTEKFVGESAEDAQVDFDALKQTNPDIFAWLYIPDTEIDCPVLQSGQSDSFYENHNAYGEEDDAGAVYIELANLASMCDFNTVLHGKTGADENGLFADLHRFADPDFFADHEYAYLYLDGNVLTYEIFAAYERENTSLIRTYDFTYLSGCRQFLSDLYGTRKMGMNLREGWNGVNEYNYVVTLTTQEEENTKRQFVVLAVLIEDAAGTINRVVME